MSKQLAAERADILANLSPYQRFQLEKYGNILAGGHLFDHTDLAAENERIAQEQAQETHLFIQQEYHEGWVGSGVPLYNR